MSGLETAIRNALDRSDRADRDIRARIYQSARQALDAGLRKQGVTDRLIVMQQHELLERRIDEIEMEEVRRLSAPPPDMAPPEILPPEPFAGADSRPHAPAIAYPAEPAYPAAPEPVEMEPPPARSASAHMVPDMTLDGETRAPAGHGSVAPAIAVAPSRAASPEHAALDDMLAELDQARDRPVPPPEPRAPSRREQRQERKPRREKAPKPSRESRKTASAAATGLDVPPERAAKPRKRRGFFSHLLNWLITLAVVGAACWYFYQSGMVQSFIDDALKTADEQSGGPGNSRLDPRRSFSDAWVEIFSPAKLAQLKPGTDAKVETVAASEGQAARILSASPGDTGDVSIDVPPELLREMAGKSSTVALTLQSGTNSSVQLSVRCDFGSLGTCSRHRFTATQEKLEALFQVGFERSLAPNRPGRLILNSGIDGANRPVMLYSVRILPGQ